MDERIYLPIIQGVPGVEGREGECGDCGLPGAAVSCLFSSCLKSNVRTRTNSTRRWD